jgi:flagellar basal-body rod protein FlgG
MVADNLASGSLPGYKRKELSLAATQAGLMPAGSQQGHGGPRSFVIPKATSVTNFQAGDLKPTGVNTDVAIDGKGFFAVQMPTGQLAYTRDGEFHVNASGELVTKEDYPVMGATGPIQLDKTNHNVVSISAQGEVTQGGTTKGKLKVTDFNNTALLTQVSGSYFVSGSPDLHEQSTTAILREGYVEGSNVSSVTQMVSLLSAMRGYEANQKLIQMEDDRMGHAISDLGNPT